MRTNKLDAEGGEEERKRKDVGQEKAAGQGKKKRQEG